MTTFATVTSTHASEPLPAHVAAQVELRRFIATRRERHSENASRMREWAGEINSERGHGSQKER